MASEADVLRKAKEHTPTPWMASEMTMTQRDWAALNPAGGTLQIIKRGSDVIAAVWAEDGIEEADNAAFIVRACNAHDDLVAALRAISDQLERIGDTRPHKDGQFIEEARAAIALAESSHD